MSGSIAAHGTSGEPSSIQSWILAVTSVFIVAFFVLMQFRRKALAKQIDAETISPSDFTLFFKGLPKNLDADDFKKFISEKCLPAGQVAGIVRVHKTYDIDEFLTLQKKYEYWRLKAVFAADETKWVKSYQAKISQRLEEINGQLEKTVNSLSERKFTGKLFVTFESEKEAKTAKSYLTGTIGGTCCKKFATVMCLNDPQSSVTYKGHSFHVGRPAEPTDVFWENLGETGKLKRKIVTNLVILLILAICFALITLSQFWKIEMKRDDDDDDQSTSEARKEQAILLVPAIVVSFLNIVLSVSIRTFCRYEKFDTYTDYNASVAWKLSISMFLNSAIVPLLVYWDDWYGFDSLIMEVWNIILTNAVLSPLYPFFDTFYAIRLIKQCAVKAAGNEANITQQQANDLFQGPTIDIAKRYANINKTLLICCFYGPIIPQAFAITFVSLLVEYNVVKYLLLRRYSRPDNLGDDLSKKMLRLLPLGAMLMCASNLIFHGNYNSLSIIPGIVGIVVTFVFIMIPIRRLSKYRKLLLDLRLIQDITITTDKTYEDYAVDFPTDYDREDPICSSQAYEDWVRLIRDKKGDKEGTKALEKVGHKLHQNITTNLVQFTGRNMNAEQVQVARLLPNLENNIAELAGVESEAIVRENRYTHLNAMKKTFKKKIKRQQRADADAQIPKTKGGPPSTPYDVGKEQSPGQNSTPLQTSLPKQSSPTNNPPGSFTPH